MQQSSLNAFYCLMVHLLIEPGHPRRIPQLFRALPRCTPQGLVELGILQHPTDRRRERRCLKWFSLGAGDAVGHDDRQAAGVEGHHRGAAGMGFEAGVGQVVLAAGDHNRIGGAMKGAQAEVVVQVAGVVHGEVELGRRLGRSLAEHHQLQSLQVGSSAQLGKSLEQQVDALARVGATAHGAGRSVASGRFRWA